MILTEVLILLVYHQDDVLLHELMDSQLLSARSHRPCVPSRPQSSS
jgi:hypothetical protein